MLLDMTFAHVPVLAGELIELLDPRPGETAIDCTFGGGGHAQLVADRLGPDGLLIGIDPLRTETVREICETVDFHGGRPWAVEVAVWDVVGRALEQPVWKLLGGRSERLLAYASTGEAVEASERAERCLALVERGVRAVKLRFNGGDWRADLEVVERVREAVGD